MSDTPYMIMVPEDQVDVVKQMIEIDEQVAAFERQQTLNSLMSFMSGSGYVRPPFVPPEAGVFRLCEGCPCLNNDSEYDSACNLGYRTKSVKIAETEKENIWKNISPDCKLQSVTTNTVILVPHSIELDGKGGFTIIDYQQPK